MVVIEKSNSKTKENDDIDPFKRIVGVSISEPFYVEARKKCWLKRVNFFNDIYFF